MPSTPNSNAGGTASNTSESHRRLIVASTRKRSAASAPSRTANGTTAYWIRVATVSAVSATKASCARRVESAITDTPAQSAPSTSG
ncbi:MAG: hypothetical protein E6G64_14640 [Actinobacteria bacterium]|nr:MAG: hypothetical protein E6G64_14640 [Actinomycetota bacterium]